MSKINQPFTFKNGLRLRNPVVMAPMTTWAGEDDGRLTQAELDYYRARANGVGMVITGTTFMQPEGKGFVGQYYGGRDETLPQLTALADTIKSGGARAVLQVFHAGRNSLPTLTGGLDVVGASDIAVEREGAVQPRPLTEEEILAIIQTFTDVTARAISAGFDGVEIHGANTFLLQQFFSPHANRRQDAWGGSLEKRARLPLAIVDAVVDTAAKLAGPEFVVGYRLSPEETWEPGISLDDTLYLVEQLARKNLSYLHLSLRHYAQTSMRDEGDQRVVGRLIAEKLAGRLPLMGVGLVHSLGDLNAAFSLGYDLVAVGKALLYDAQWYEKQCRGETPERTLADALRQIVPQRMFASLYGRREVMNVSFSGR